MMGNFSMVPKTDVLYTDIDPEKSDRYQESHSITFFVLC